MSEKSFPGGHPAASARAEGRPWYEHWFNEDYLALYGHRDSEDARAQVDLLLAHARLPTGARVLDLGCGEGRHAAHLAKAGFDVTAQDLSEDLLRRAREKVPGVRFLRRDMRVLEGCFHAVTLFFTSFGYFDDSENRRLLATVADHLEPGGVLWLDFFHAGHARAALVPRNEREADGRPAIEEREIRDGRLIKRITLRGAEGERRYEESVAFYSPEELQERIEAAGLSVEAVFGDVHGAALTPDRSRAIFLARKPG